MTSGRPLVLVANLDSLKQKNLYQASALPEYRFVFACYRLAKDFTGSEAVQALVYPQSLVRRGLYCFRLLRRHRADIHHVELYTGNGAFFAFELLLAKLLGIKVVVAERGALLNVSSTTRIRRGCLKLAYRYADEVWIRELWMAAAIEKLAGRQDVFFNANAVEVPTSPSRLPYDARSIDFLWVNSLKPWRNATRFCRVLRDPRLAGCMTEIVGFLKVTSTDVLAEQETVRGLAGESVRLRDFENPEPYYARARYFVLPADIVFLNIALLEAMGRGVVPLVADVDGAREIVEDGIDGIVFPHSEDGLLAALVEARKLSAERWEAMSMRAIEKVRKSFSLPAWADRMRALYARLDRP